MNVVWKFSKTSPNYFFLFVFFLRTFFILSSVLYELFANALVFFVFRSFFTDFNQMRVHYKLLRLKKFRIKIWLCSADFELFSSFFSVFCFHSLLLWNLFELFFFFLYFLWIPYVLLQEFSTYFLFLFWTECPTGFLLLDTNSSSILRYLKKRHQ